MPDNSKTFERVVREAFKEGARYGANLAKDKDSRRLQEAFDDWRNKQLP